MSIKLCICNPSYTWKNFLVINFKYLTMNFNERCQDDLDFMILAEDVCLPFMQSLTKPIIGL